MEMVDAVIVGSGFGGSVTALRLAQENKSVVLLERGKCWPPGSFARRPDEFARNLWDPSEGLQGLFDVWSFRHLDAVVSSGLGGGSLIYANVLIRKPEEWFVSSPGAGAGHESWPVTYDDLKPYYSIVEDELGATPYPYPDTTPKTQLMLRAAERLGKDCYLPNMAVTFLDKPGRPLPAELGENMYDAPRYSCRLCGDCDIGCNYGSKNTLDLTLLSRAKKLGAVLHSRCEVRRFQPCEGGFRVFYVEHVPENEGAPLDTSQLPLHEIRCRRLILAAGSLGTTFLLLRNRDAFPGLSPALGTHFSGNGDVLAWIHGSPDRLEPSYGPVITSTWYSKDYADGGDGPGFYLQDGGHPIFIDWVFQQLRPPIGRSARFFASRLLAGLRAKRPSEIGGAVAGLFGGGRPDAGILPLLAFGRDVPDGRMRLRKGLLDVDLSDRSSRALSARIQQAMAELAQEAGGKVFASPGTLLHRRMSAHPLGGVPMGSTPAAGVVDKWGQAFGYPGLFVVDGSVMPGPVGTNPSLTIAALASRFADRMLDTWGELE